MNAAVRILDRALTLMSIVALAFILFVAFRRDGFARKRIEAWQLHRRQEEALRRMWPQLIEAGYVLGTGRKVIAVEFSDYQCPFCRASAPLVDSFLSRHDSLAIVYVHFPLANHSSADPAARAAICAQNQGKAREMHRVLFSTAEWEQDGHDWGVEATLAGIPDIGTYRICLSDPLTYHRVEWFKEIGRAIGVDGTPTFLSLSGRWLGIPDTTRLLPALMKSHP